MSSVRGANNPRGRRRGRGSAPTGPSRGRGSSQQRGGFVNGTTSSRGGTVPGRVFSQAARGFSNPRARGQNHARGNAAVQSRQPLGTPSSTPTNGSWQERYSALTKARERERADAIRQGIIADPDKPRTLSEAITPVGTCQDLCAEYERVERVVQKDVWTEELNPDQSAYARNDKEPDESRMVKKFRRAAAGLEEQLPSDLRPPHVLKRTCDYLFDEVIGNAPSLAKVHHFVWDRTRAIRNDFSIQQLTKSSELSIAVECYERIARFHIVSLHQLALPERPYSKYDGQQEREQLDRTLLSLMQYYDDCRGRINLPKEAEFRAYCVIFQLQNPTPDLEERVQNWPRAVLRDNRIRRALDVYMAACNVMDDQGPLRPRAKHLIAQQDWQRFWRLVESSQVSYLMACVAEIYFNLVRRTVINALFKAFRANSSSPTTEWSVDELVELLAFDDEDEVYKYCELFGFAFKERDDGQRYLDLTSVPGRQLPDPNAGMVKQAKSRLVENKRCGRTLPAVINGLAVQQAQEAGLVVEEEREDEGMEDVHNDESQPAAAKASSDEEDDGESLFLPQKKELNTAPISTTPSLFKGFETQPAGQPQEQPFSWGKASDAGPQPTLTIGQPTTSPFAAPAPSKSPFNFLSGGNKPSDNASTQPPKFNFLTGTAAATQESGDKSTTTGNAAQPNLTASSNVGASSNAPTFPFASTSAPAWAGFDGATRKVTSGASNASKKSEEDVSSSPAPTLQGGAILANSTAAPPVTNATTNPFAFLTSPSSEKFNASKAATPDKTPSLFSAKPAIATSPTSSETTSTESLFPPAKAETTPSFSAQPPDSKQPPQHHFTTPTPQLSAPVQPSQPSLPSAPPSPSNLNTNFRRPSASTDTKPKKPSPLSHSFTATEDNTAAKSAQKSDSLAEKNTPSEQQTAPSEKSAAPELFPRKQEQLVKPTPFKRPSAQVKESVESLEATVDRVAKELVNDPCSGYLKQFIEYKVGQTITSVQQELAAEYRTLRLNELRVLTISRKFVKRWASIAWQQRVAKSGRERRQRRRRRLEEGFDDGSVRDDDSLRGSSRPESDMGSVVSCIDHRQTVDAMFQRTMNSTRSVRPTPHNNQARAGSKRPVSSHGENAPSARESDHKRLKSTSHVDDRGRVKKPTPTSDPNADILKRSSFLAYGTTGSSPPSKNTTKSSYFKLKALGIHRADELSKPRGTKRSRTESAQPVQTSPPALQQSTSLASSPDGSASRMLMPPPSSTSSRAVKIREEDEALFARLRAARESLTDGATFMKSEVAKEEEFRRSRSASQSSNDSPSMIRARMEARARASGADSTERDVPAYRMRESRFVPREHYGRAIERSKDMRESRSRETSRPVSRIEQEAPAHAANLSFDASVGESHPSQADIPNGLPDYTSAAPLSTLDAPTSAPQPIFPSQASWSFANHTTPLDKANPFLPSTVQQTPSTFGSFAPKPAFGGGSGFGSTFQPQPPASSQPTFVPPPGLYTQLGFGAKPTFGSQSGFGSAPIAQPTYPAAEAFDVAPTFHSQPSSAPQIAVDNDNVQSPVSAPLDQTIQPEMINESLANSFGHEEESYPDPLQLLGSHVAGTQQQEAEFYPLPPQQSSYMHTDTIDLLDDDDDDDEEDDETTHLPEVQPGLENGVDQSEATESSSDEVTDEVTDDNAFEPPYGQANPYAVLADQGGMGDNNAFESSVEGSESYEQDEFEGYQNQLTNGFENEQYRDEVENGLYPPEENYYEDEEGMDGDIDDESEVDMDEEGEGFDESEVEDEEEAHQPPPGYVLGNPDVYGRPQWVKQADPALLNAGKTEDAPIELDSD